jgi:hypothetical protein
MTPEYFAQLERSGALGAIEFASGQWNLPTDLLLTLCFDRGLLNPSESQVFALASEIAVRRGRAKRLTRVDPFEFVDTKEASALLEGFYSGNEMKEAA